MTPQSCGGLKSQSETLLDFHKRLKYIRLFVVRARSKSSKSRKEHPHGGGFYWLLTALALGALGWIWWKAIQISPQPGRKNKTISLTEKSEDAKPSAQNNIPVSPPAVTVTNDGVAVKKEASAIQLPEIPTTERGKHEVKTLVEAQVALSRLGISCGSVDGVLGSQTRAALRVFQQRKKLPVTGFLDEPTRERLFLSDEPFKHWVVTRDALSRLKPVPKTWLGKSEAQRLDYETILEMVAEEGHAHPDYIKKLNPGIVWDKVSVGQSITIPNMEYPTATASASCVKIHLGRKSLEVFDANSNLLAHFPCSIAKKAEKRPVGELHVITVVKNPNYAFNPEVFPESEEGRRIGRKLILPPGPNNPVGVAWIGLDKPGYGMHGTPRPEDVGRTESHGCFRLANWNAEYLAGMVSIGTPVLVEP